MSWEHFELGLRTLQHEEQRSILTTARGGRIAQANKQEHYNEAVQEIELLAGLR